DLPFELGQRHRQLELAKPGGLVVDRLLFTAAQGAGGEEQEQGRGDADERVLGISERAAGRFGGSGGLGKRHLTDRDGVAALGLDARGVGDRFLDGGYRGGWHAFVEQHGYVLAFDGARRDRGVGDG